MQSKMANAITHNVSFLLHKLANSFKLLVYCFVIIIVVVAGSHGVILKAKRRPEETQASHDTKC